MDIDSKGKKENKVDASALPHMPFIFGVTPDQAKELRVGDNIKVRVQGEVVSIRKPMLTAMDGKASTDKYEIELRTADKVEVESNPADVALRKLRTQPNASDT